MVTLHYLYILYYYKSILLTAVVEAVDVCGDDISVGSIRLIPLRSLFVLVATFLYLHFLVNERAFLSAISKKKKKKNTWLNIIRPIPHEKTSTHLHTPVSKQWSSPNVCAFIHKRLITHSSLYKCAHSSSLFSLRV